MKKFFLIFLIILPSFLYSQEYKLLKDYNFYYQGEIKLQIHGINILWYDFASEKWHDTSNLYTKFSYKVNENGFVEVFCNENKFFLLEHEITYVDSSRNGMPVLDKSQLLAIKSSGNFSEKINGKVVDYNAENLRTAVIWGGREDPFWYYEWNEPFVTKRGNSGIGEYIDLSFVNPQKSISILGGFVRTTRQDLFRKNNRLKKVLIKDLDSDYSAIMNFEDVAMFQGIAFEKYLKNIRIEILEVFKGTQYDDTCISGIMISNFYPLKE
ncbi:hypothetical protein [Treponema sp.]|uniref:NADase-type glycan-binding domain-containing protein n=1 Tax=Treponema sp. TaxID=166 RepID=UPI0025FFE46F|nr:hypothetical protein [Treponema sp.]MBR4322869.1 hypothetical protein [Treponema sp.]